MKNGKPETIDEKRAEILALSAFLVEADYLDELITEFQGDPEEAAFVKHCRFLRKVKHHIEVTDANLGLHEQFKAAQKNVLARTKNHLTKTKVS